MSRRWTRAPTLATTFISSHAAAGWRTIRFRPTRRRGASTASSKKRTRSISGACSKTPRSRRADRTAVQQKIGDYFAACMNTSAIETLGAKAAAAAARRDPRHQDKREAGRISGEGTSPQLQLRISVRLRRRSGFRRRNAGHRVRARRRTGPARPRLLHEERREIEGDPPEVSAARRAHAPAHRRDENAGGEGCRGR